VTLIFSNTSRSQSSSAHILHPYRRRRKSVWATSAHYSRDSWI